MKRQPFTLQESDSATTKFEGALVNALIVVAAVTGMTFVLFLLYKYRVRRLEVASPLPSACCITANLVVVLQTKLLCFLRELGFFLISSLPASSWQAATDVSKQQVVSLML